MQHTAAMQPAAKDSDFAGIFTTLADPEKKFPPAWDDDGLANDIATLSYEAALRNQSRYQANRVEPLERLEPLKEPVFDSDFDAGIKAAPIRATPGLAKTADTDTRGKAQRPSSLEDSFKRASVTVRLSETEISQLRVRAEEAGLTVSAYLRSCTFEAENLRAMVKNTLNQLKNATAIATPAEPPAATAKPRLRWWQRLWQLVFRARAIA